MEDTWKFIGWFLTKESKLALIRRFGKEIPEGWITYCDHMTLAFNNGSPFSKAVKEYYEPAEGSSMKLTIDKIGKSDRAIAVHVDYLLAATNSITHITLAVAPGAKPVESNSIKEWIDLESPVTVDTTLKIIGKK